MTNRYYERLMENLLDEMRADGFVFDELGNTECELSWAKCIDEARRAHEKTIAEMEKNPENPANPENPRNGGGK